MTYLLSIFNFILEIDIYLGEVISTYGTATYLLLFGIIFAETGFVLTPFLPGDSLLFAAGAFSGLGSLNLIVLLVLLTTAAILGDTVNYWIGHFFGEKMIANPKIPIEQKHIDKTNAFFAKYGGKTIILARFVPIVRTFAPFVAGVGQMNYQRFFLFNVAGGVLWCGIFILSGFFFGNIPAIKENFSLVVIAIIILSVAPMVLEFAQHFLRKKI